MLAKLDLVVIKKKEEQYSCEDIDDDSFDGCLPATSFR